jgi:hypothetical protein
VLPQRTRRMKRNLYQADRWACWGASLTAGAEHPPRDRAAKSRCRQSTAIQATSVALPQGPSPVRAMLSRSIITYPATSASLAGTSRFHCSAAYTQRVRLRERGATGERFRAFTAHSFLSCRLLRPRGVRVAGSRQRHKPSPRSEQLGTPPHPCNPFHAGRIISGFPEFTHLLRPVSLLAPLARIQPASRPSGTFTTKASNGSVAFPLGYNYNRD